MNQALSNKYEALKKYFQDLGSVAIAFSGGVDSTLMVKVARDCLGDKMMAITAKTDYIAGRELTEATEFCRSLGIKHEVVHLDGLSIPGFKENPKNRCYICKLSLFNQLIDIAHANGIENVAEGSNLDDLGDYRPGLQAIKELEVKSPLRACQMTKQDIRDLSKELDLPTWDKPSFACLASRFAYGQEITREGLKRVELAEQFLIDQGLTQMRVRIHDIVGASLARIEVPVHDIGRITGEDLRGEIVSKFKEIGFNYVSLDLQGYRTGSMNETLSTKEKEEGLRGE